MKLVIGLGNPGMRYERTRHNFGAMAVQQAARQLDVRLSHGSHQALWGRGRHQEQDVLLALPQTFMNLSGAAAADLSRYFRIPPSDLLVVSDDLHLDLGRLRFRTAGSAGGHNGLASVIEHLGTDQFPRLRLGIGETPPGADQAEYVLTRFAAAEAEPVGRVLELAAAGISQWIGRGRVDTGAPA